MAGSKAAAAEERLAALENLVTAQAAEIARVQARTAQLPEPEAPLTEAARQALADIEAREQAARQSCIYGDVFTPGGRLPFEQPEPELPTVLRDSNYVTVEKNAFGGYTIRGDTESQLRHSRGWPECKCTQCSELAAYR